METLTPLPEKTYRTFECDLCHKKFMTEFQLMNHKTTHLNFKERKAIKKEEKDTGPEKEQEET